MSENEAAASADQQWMAVPDVAEALGVSPGAVREMLRERHLIAARRGENNAWYVPAQALDLGAEGPRPVPTLRGTLMLLADAGFSDDEALAWLLAPNDELGRPPLDALAAGQRAKVRRIAQALF